MDEKKSTELVPVSETRAELPPILAGRHTTAVEAQVRSFYISVAEIFERWVTRRSSTHTQRAYRQDVMDFVRFLGLRWPDESTRLFTVSVADVLAFRDWMLAESKAPKTINRRIASLSSFYKYLQGVASEFRLPITVPNPAHAQFIARGSSDPRDETKALSATRARQLMGLPSGDTVFDYRDQAIIIRLSQKEKVLRQTFATRKCHRIQGMCPNRKTYDFSDVWPRRTLWSLELWIEPFRGKMQKTPYNV